MNSERNTIPAQAISIGLIFFSVVCCACGGIQTFLGLTMPADFNDMSLPGLNGFIDPTTAALANLVTTISIAIPILLVAIGVWYVFGRNVDIENRIALAFSIFLAIGGVTGLLWLVSTLVSAYALQGQLITGFQLRPGDFIGMTLVCAVPIIILFCASVAVWWFFVRGNNSMPTRSNRRTAPPRRRT